MKEREVRARIQKAMAQIARERGITSLTVKGVVEHAGVSTNTFYSLYTSTDDVVGEILDEACAAMHDAVLRGEAEGETALRKVSLALHHMFRIYVENFEVADFAAVTATLSPKLLSKRCRETVDDSFHTLDRVLNQASAELGLLRPVRADAFMQTVPQPIFTVLRKKLASGEAVTPEDVEAAIAKTLSVFLEAERGIIESERHA